MIEHPRTIPRQPRGSAGVNLQQYTPKTTPKKPASTSPGPQPQPPALPGQWLPAFIWMPAAPGIMPGSPPPMVPSMPIQFSQHATPPPPPGVPPSGVHAPPGPPVEAKRRDDGAARGATAKGVPARKREESEPSSEAGFASKMVCS